MFFGFVGYLAKRYDYPAAPLVLGSILGNRLELALRRSLSISQGDISILYTRPLSAVLLAGAVNGDKKNLAVPELFLFTLLREILALIPPQCLCTKSETPHTFSHQEHLISKTVFVWLPRFHLWPSGELRIRPVKGKAFSKPIILTVSMYKRYIKLISISISTPGGPGHG
jgi:hypothetical protein